MNGISPLNYRPVSLEKERRAMRVMTTILSLVLLAVLAVWLFWRRR